MRLTLPDWQARRVSNPQPTVLETAILPIELLTCIRQTQRTDDYIPKKGLINI